MLITLEAIFLRLAGQVRCQRYPVYIDPFQAILRNARQEVRPDPKMSMTRENASAAAYAFPQAFISRRIACAQQLTMCRCSNGNTVTTVL